MREAGSGIGAVIGAGFGLTFVIINAGALPAPLHIALLAAAGVGCAAILWFAYAGRGSPDRGRSPFGRRYWLIVLAEAAALFGGTKYLENVGCPDLGVAWVSFVVGTHFFALGAIFGLRRFHVLAVLVSGCGAGALLWGLLAGSVASVGVAVLGGVVPGFLLLGFSLWAVWPVEAHDP